MIFIFYQIEKNFTLSTKKIFFYQIDDDVFVEFLAPLRRHVAHVHDRFRIVGVDVKNRTSDHLRHVGAIGTRPRKPGIRRETDLIVGDEMDRPVTRVIGQIAQVERFVNDP